GRIFVAMAIAWACHHVCGKQPEIGIVPSDPLQTNSISPPLWVLLAIFRVEWSDRVQCQCQGCGQTIYASIHMIRSSTGEIQCWGSECYKRELGFTNRQPLYAGVNGRKLNASEREMLLANRDRLLAAFKEEQETAHQLREEERRKVKEAEEIREA